MMRKIYALLTLALVFALAGIFSACELDTAARAIVSFEDPSGGNKIEDLLVEKGGTMGDDMPVLQERQGLLFCGWYDGNTRYDRDTVITDDVKLTARWSDDIVTVTFVFTQKDSGNNVILPVGSNGAVLSIPPVMAVRDLPLGPTVFPVTPRARGWEFITWVLDGEDFTATTPVPDDITLEAYWIPKKVFTVEFNPGPGMEHYSMDVYENECIDEWTKPGENTKFPAKLKLGDNPLKPLAFFVAWLDDENREYDGRTPITRDLVGDSAITGKWGLPPFKVDLRTVANGGHIDGLVADASADYGSVDYSPVSRKAWDDPLKDVIVNTITYDAPLNTNRWRILYRIKLNLPDFNIGFYSRYTIRARFYANKQGGPNPPSSTSFTPNKPAAGVGYSEDGWLTSKDYKAAANPNPSRSDDGWGQVSWCSKANWNGAGSDGDTMLQRYNLDRKGGTINDTWAPLRGKDMAYPPYLLIQTSDSYIGHIEITDIIFHNGEKKFTMYVDEEGYEDAPEVLE